MADPVKADVQPNDLPLFADQIALGSRFSTVIPVPADPTFPEYTGEVHVKFPSVGDLVEIEVRMRRLLGGFTQEEVIEAAVVTRALATLAVVVTKAPSWWYVKYETTGTLIAAPEACKSMNILSRLYGAYRDWSESFFRRGNAPDQGPSEAPTKPDTVDPSPDDRSGPIPSRVSG